LSNLEKKKDLFRPFYRNIINYLLDKKDEIRYFMEKKPKGKKNKTVKRRKVKKL